MQTVLSDMLGRRRDRAIAIILGLKERECDASLSKDASLKLRKTVLDQFNDYHDFVMDVCKSLTSDDDNIVLNEHYLELIDEIHRTVVGG